MGTKELLYAAIGAGELAVDRARKARESFDLAEMRKGLVEIRKDMAGFRSELPKRLQKTTAKVSKTGNRAVGRGFTIYQDLVKRGKATVVGIRNSTPTKRAADQTKAARRQTKAAVGSVKKAATEAVEAAREAASNL